MKSLEELSIPDPSFLLAELCVVLENCSLNFLTVVYLSTDWYYEFFSSLKHDNFFFWLRTKGALMVLLLEIEAEGVLGPTTMPEHSFEMGDLIKRWLNWFESNSILHLLFAGNRVACLTNTFGSIYWFKSLLL